MRVGFKVPKVAIILNGIIDYKTVLSKGKPRINTLTLGTQN